MTDHAGRAPGTRWPSTWLQQRGRDRLLPGDRQQPQIGRDLCPVITISSRNYPYCPIPWLRPEEIGRAAKIAGKTANHGEPGPSSVGRADRGELGGAGGACTGGKRAGDSGGTNQDPFVNYRAGGSCGRPLATRPAARDTVSRTRSSSSAAIAATLARTRLSQAFRATAAASTSACCVAAASS